MAVVVINGEEVEGLSVLSNYCIALNDLFVPYSLLGLDIF